jgi:hypothetical protein
MQAMTEICVARYEAFGTAGHASKIKAISLEHMSERYERGNWTQRSTDRSAHAIPQNPAQAGFCFLDAG